MKNRDEVLGKTSSTTTTTLLPLFFCFIYRNVYMKLCCML